MESDQNIRVRFAPSPTGPLHIGGVRTALYNYLFAKNRGGTFILRIEDTDQKRFVPGAEEYIVESLEWLGLQPDEGPQQGGDFGPYRQSERSELYKKYAQQLLEKGHAYMAFDTEEELDAIRKSYESKKTAFKYDASVRHQMNNSLCLSEEEVREKLAAGEPYVIRMLVPENEKVTFSDAVREQVTFDTNELDDKVIMKADGLPTYHLANVIDDYHMKISHVIRGEEWISSTGHHVLLYRMMGWEDEIPEFVHLPLILKPGGGGKLSKRDGLKMDMPIVPLRWYDEETATEFSGFREAGFLPEATINFLALLGWAPGIDREIYNLEELTQVFSLSQISLSGARFDIQKARWFNQQYLIKADMDDLATYIKKWFPEIYKLTGPEFLKEILKMYVERIHVIPEFLDQAGHFFTELPEYDEAQIQKRYKSENETLYKELFEAVKGQELFKAEEVKNVIHEFVAQKSTKFGVVLPVLRLAVAGNLQGPDLFTMMEILGKEKVGHRLDYALEYFANIKSNQDGQ